MALMFSRLARNFIKNGYFPTDDATIERVTGALSLLADRSAGKGFRFLDPCCGEGTALANVMHGLQQQDDPEVCIETFGIELDSERAVHARQVLDRALRSDVHDVIISPRSMSLLFLNPPYGYGVSDTAERGDHSKAERLERTFLKKCAPCLAVGGILVYIIPYYALDDDIANYLARNFTDLRVFIASEQKFKQCVVFGVKRKSGTASKQVISSLIDAQQGAAALEELPQNWNGSQYIIPMVDVVPEFQFYAVRLDPEQLAAELTRSGKCLLWDEFDNFFRQQKSGQRRPLCDLTRWHLALALAAGQVTGLIKSLGGRVVLIKGDTIKSKSRSISTVTDEEGNITQTVTLLDKFVPTITAIEMSQGENLGRIINIR